MRNSLELRGLMMANRESGENTEAVQGLTALYSGVLQNLSMAQSADNAIEAKAVGVTALSLAAIALVIQLSDDWHALTVIGLLALVASLVAAFFSLKINDYRSAAVKVADHPEYLKKNDRDLLLQLISDAESSYDNTDGIVRRKAKLFTWSYILLLIGTLLGLASLKFMIIQI